jgi:DNA-binding LacI/PurR family transcriptional regulator
MKKPKYKIISDRLKQKIISGTLSTFDKAPTIREIQLEYDCSTYTAHKAMQILKKNGMMNIEHGKKATLKQIPISNGLQGNMHAFFPEWNLLGADSFAALFTLGLSMAASSRGYSISVTPYKDLGVEGSNNERNRMMEIIKNNSFRGVIWGSPSIDSSLFLARLEAMSIKTVTTHRTYSGLSSPYTYDDYSDSFSRAALKMKEAGIKTTCVISQSFKDATYSKILKIFIKKMNEAGIQILENGILYLNYSGVYPPEYREPLYERFFQINKRADACWMFTPNILQHVLHLEEEKKIIPSKFKGVLTPKSWIDEGADLTIESNIVDHASKAVELLIEWIENGEKPSPYGVPCNLIDSNAKEITKRRII